MSRTLAREAAFKALFQLDFNFDDDRREYCEDLAIKTMFDDNPKLNKSDIPFLESLVKGTREHLNEIDALIIANLKEGWQLPRIMAALLENNQTPEGIRVPECLHKYTGFTIID